MVTHNGFSLIELLIYSTLSIFLVMMVLQFVMKFEQSIIARSGAALYQTSLYACIDSIARDCAAAPANQALWVVEQPDKIIWQDEQGVRGFLFEHDRLIRISRSFDRARQLKSPVYSILLNNVHGSFAVYRLRDYISMITISLTTSCHNAVMTMDKHVHLCTGVVS